MLMSLPMCGEELPATRTATTADRTVTQRSRREDAECAGKETIYSARSGERRGAERAPARRDGHLAETLRALFRRRIRRRLATIEARGQAVHRQHDEEIDS